MEIKNKVTKSMAVHPKLVAVALSVGLTFAVTIAIGIAGQPHQVYAYRPDNPWDLAGTC
ncbi:MAG: hypothetical protein JO327_11095 [Nitrososphaeraceae archaeon]|nr:hypothetical protein [Nitrososphaeraceae archaeon]MBV9668660.1 hypothetical protein [Nitrososphaeraceae archaeon]